MEPSYKPGEIGGIEFYVPGRERESWRESLIVWPVLLPTPDKEGLTQDKHTVGEKTSPLDSVPGHLSRLHLLPKQV